MIALRFERYGFRYSIADHPVLQQLSLELPAGKVVSVIGPQGKGKTTVLRAAAGLLGEIYQGDVSGSVGDTGDCAAFFDGYVQVTLAVETVREEIGLPLLASGMRRGDRDARATAVARELKIEHLLDRRVTNLSGGEEKLVGIAAALVPDSSVHVLDEPFEQLDVPHIASVIRAMKNRARLGRLILVATSSPDTAVNIADASICWDDGWKYVERPTYDEAIGDGESAVGRFVGSHRERLAGIRRFRDAAVVGGSVILSPLTGVNSAKGLPSPPQESPLRFAQGDMVRKAQGDERLLEVRSVGFGYTPDRKVLSDATLELPYHMVCAILGPNGAGKSTLARLAAGVFQPSAGRVIVAGQDLSAVAGVERAKRVRVSFQTPEHELFRQTLGAELDWEADLLGRSREEMRARVSAAIAACGAEFPLDSHPYDLDPWQRKLFACLSALAVPGRLVILDEPTLRLGQQVRSRLGEQMRAYAAEGGGVIIVTHEHEFAARTCDMVAVVKGGKIELAGPTAATLETAAGHAATNIYSFPSFYLDRAVRRRSV